jgi:two-component system, OmpR family, catabolic regulation response regulator CreB
MAKLSEKHRNTPLEFPKRVLLVEDESSIADNVRLALGEEGILLDHCKTAREAKHLLQASRHSDHQVLILDVGLPDQTGFELCKSLRSEGIETPILFLTARSEEVDKIIGFEIGADDYLTKPFSARELTARVKALAKRFRLNNESDSDSKIALLKSGPFEVDLEKFKVRFFGEMLELSRYEFRLLETLIRRPGVVFSRQQLMEAVWEDPGMSLERTVDAHIKTLRAKLKAIREEPSPIETHRGLGYSLKEGISEN